jgi:hypothetical protein
VLPLIYFLFTGKSCLLLAINTKKAFIAAFKKSASKLVIKDTLECLETENKIPKSITRFIVPAGATLNFDGTAIYIIILCIFTSQMSCQYLKLIDYLLLRLEQDKIIAKTWIPKFLRKFHSRFPKKSTKTIMNDFHRYLTRINEQEKKIKKSENIVE